MKTADFLTDMASEAVQNVKNGLVPYTFERLSNGVTRTVVKVDTAHKSRLVGKRQGIYVTLETDCETPDKKVSETLSAEIASQIVRLSAIMKKGLKKVMVIGLGNRDVEADALGALTVSKLKITRPYFVGHSVECKGGTNLCAVVPGVYAATGIESADIVSAVINKVQPDIIIAVDALAAARAKRLYRSYQLTTAGIVPGSGVGSGSGELSEKTLKIPVLSVGVPLALYASSMIKEGAAKYCKNANADISASVLSGVVEEVLGEKNLGLVVTPKSIGSFVEKAADILAAAINRAFRN